MNKKAMGPFIQQSFIEHQRIEGFYRGLCCSRVKPLPKPLILTHLKEVRRNIFSNCDPKEQKQTSLVKEI